MGRVDKLYAALDVLVLEYQGHLVAELQKEGKSLYFHRCFWDVEYAGRPYNIRGKEGGFEAAETLVSLERQIRRICTKMGEPLPLPIQVLDEYVKTYLSLKEKKTTYTWHTEDFEGEHKQLKKQMLQKLL